MPPRKDRPIVEKRCGAATRKGAECKNPAGAGTDHFGYGRCKNHTGSTPAGRLSAAKQELVERQLQALAYGIDATIDVEPHQAIAEEVARTNGHIRWLQDKLGIVDDPTELVPVGQDGNRIPGVWLQLYLNERAHLVRTAKTAIDCGVQEREVRIREKQGELLAGAIRAILERMPLTDDQRAAAPVIVREVLLEFAALEVAPQPALTEAIDV